MASWQLSLGVSADISPFNFVGFLLHSSASIVFLVFLNTTQPFLISQLGDVKHQGSISGNLIFADELFSMFLVLVWGSLADIVGTKPVAVTGYLCIAFALATYTIAGKPWPDLLYCRLLFALGGSAVTTMLSGILNSYSSSPQSPSNQDTSIESNERPADENTSLLPQQPNGRTPSKSFHGRLAALAGVSTGFGALLSVFVLLRLPTLLARLHDGKSHQKDKALQQGMRESFIIVSVLAVLVAIALGLTLRMDKPLLRRRESSIVQEENLDEAPSSSVTPSSREERRQRMKSRLRNNRSRTVGLQLVQGVFQLARGSIAGFSLASRNMDLTLAYIGGGLARACTIATTVFVPLLVTRFFYTSGLCTDLDTPDVPAEELKRRCRQAFTVASILSGVIQLVALVMAPLVGWLCDTYSPAHALLTTTSIGTFAFLTMALGLPDGGDPKTGQAYIAAVGIGICQIGAIVASLAQCAQAKSQLRSTTQKHTVVDVVEQAQTASMTGAGMSSSELAAEEESRRKRGNKRLPYRRSRTQNSSTFARTLLSTSSSSQTSGAIAGAYSAVGGLSILFVSLFGGFLSDLYAPAAFLLMTGFSALTCLVSAIGVIRTRRRQVESED